MTLRLAGRMAKLRASEIREILKLTQDRSVISFAGGLPAPELFPVDDMKSVSLQVLDEEGADALQYSTTEGDPSLRRRIAERMDAALGTRVSPDEILVTSGSQQVLDLTGKVFLDKGDVVLLESPTYLGAMNAFRAFEPVFEAVPTDDEGMIPSALERRLAEGGPVKLIYVNPDFQNPTGRSWSLHRRRLFMEIVTRFRVPVVEDNPYGDLRFEGLPVPCLKSMDAEGVVVYSGTFSKILCPGLRVGWLAAAPPLRAKYVLVKQGTDLHTSTLNQRMVATVLDRFDLDGRLERIRSVYRARRDAMVRAIEREFPAGIRFTRPSGGLFLWVELPERVDSRELLSRCLERGVAFVPGGSFFPEAGHENTFRLNYSNMPEERIGEGIRRLGDVLRDMMGHSGRKA